MFTKGKWKAVMEGNGYWKIYDESGKEIAIAYTAKTEKILEANARLIAKSPRMIEWIERVAVKQSGWIYQTDLVDAKEILAEVKNE